LLGWIGDTLWVIDRDNNRITFVTPDHKLLRTTPLPLQVTPPAGQANSKDEFLVDVQEILADGSLLAQMSFGARNPIPVWMHWDQNSLPYLRIRPNGGFIAPVPAPMGPHAQSCRAMTVPLRGTQFPINTPFCSRGLAPLSFRNHSVSVYQDNLATPDPTYHIVSMGWKGDTLFNRTYSYVAIPIGKRAADSARTATGVMPARLGYVGTAISSIVMPTYYAPVKGILTGDDGSTWLEMNAAQPGHLWRVLDGKGNVVADVTVPANTVVARVSKATAWGIVTDKDGVQSVVRYAIR
jgi:hypothetical protein